MNVMHYHLYINPARRRREENAEVQIVHDAALSNSTALWPLLIPLSVLLIGLLWVILPALGDRRKARLTNNLRRMSGEKK